MINVFSGKIVEGDIAVSGGQIAGIGNYEGKEVVDAKDAMRLLDLLTAISILNLLM